MKLPPYYLKLCASPDGVREEEIWTGLTGDLARLAVQIAEDVEEGRVEVVNEPAR